MSEEMDRTVRRPLWRSRPATVALGAAVVVVLTLVMAFAFLSPAQRSVRLPLAQVSIDSVQHGVFHDFTTLQGTVAPRDVIYLDALEGGQVQKVLVHAGDRVSAGQPLLLFRNTQLELDVMEREAREVESITQQQSYEKQLEQTRADNQKALALIDYNVTRLQQQADRRDDLVKAGYVAKEAAELVRDELNYNKLIRPVQVETNQRQEALRVQQLPKIHMEMANLQKSLQITRTTLDDLTVKAPVAGRLTAMDLQIGENRNRGDRLGEITMDSGFKISAQVDEYYLGRVAQGQTAQIDLDGRTLNLKVERIYPQVKGGVFNVDLSFQGAQPQGLLPGEAVQGKLSLGADRPALVLPAGAFLERSGGDWVFVVAPDGGHADRRRIKIGRRNSEQVEVLSGLRAGERVITSDYQGLEKIDRVDLKR
ncbi:MAG TPA: efflux RND transporter periplasmic adaptor subunit [Caulobacteraceae bacterium]